MLRVTGSYSVAFCAAWVCAAVPRTTTTSPTTVDIDARGPWGISGAGLKDLRPAPDDPRRLVAALGQAASDTLVRFCPAAIADLSRRWPLGLAESFEVTAEIRGGPGPGDAPPTWSLFWKDALWRFHKTGAQPAAGPCRLVLPADGVSDLVEIGVVFYWPPAARRTDGSISIRIDRLVLRTSGLHERPLPPEGPRVATLGAQYNWHPDDLCPGITSISHEAGRTQLMCALDSKDRKRRHGGVWIDVASTNAPTDFSQRGVFVTVRAPAGFVCRDNTGCSLSVGLRDADGNVFWSEGTGIMAVDEPTTAALYPEMRFPLPLTFCSERFDPKRVTAIGARLKLDDRKGATFAGAVTVEDARVVSLPDELRARRDRIAERIGRENWMSTIAARATQRKAENPSASGATGSLPARALADKPPVAPLREEPGGLGPKPVPIAEFIENVGADFPWPKDVYPSVGRRPWDPSRGGFSACKGQLARDFEYLAAHHVRMIRMFIFCDAQTAVAEDERGRLVLDPKVLPDIRALLDVLGRFQSLRLVPALFDFHIADGLERNGLAKVGEYPEWLTNLAKRTELLDAVQPAIDMLCSHPQVAFVDLMNEPEHAGGVGIDDMRAFISELAARVHRHPRGVRCTVGSATAIFAPFWLSTGIDFATCHWFDKIDPSHPLGQRSAALDPNACLMTEVDPGPDVAESLTTLWQAGFRGAWLWSLNAGDEYDFRGPPAEALRRWVETHDKRR
jgi:hypothetical protein